MLVSFSKTSQDQIHCIWAQLTLKCTSSCHDRKYVRLRHAWDPSHLAQQLGARRMPSAMAYEKYGLFLTPVGVERTWPQTQKLWERLGEYEQSMAQCGRRNWNSRENCYWGPRAWVCTTIIKMWNKQYRDGKGKSSPESKWNGIRVRGKASMSRATVPGMPGGPYELVSRTSVQSLFKSA
jgi:hypothetical protein